MLSTIFKAYDVRGIYGKELADETAYNIGKAFVSFLKCKEVIVGHDMRVSSPKLSKAFINGVNDSGADAIDIGMVSTDALYFASGFLKRPGVMLTASHNPKEYNGIKFCKENAVPINEDTGLNEIKAIIEKNKYENLGEKGKITKKDILEDYGNHTLKFIDKSKIKKLRIAVDSGNGMAGKIVPLAYKNLPIEIIPLYFELDGTFPNHPADPSRKENLKQLQKSVKEKKCDFGMAFDGDADRIFFIDENANIINSSLMSCLIIKNILEKHKNEKIIYNLVCSRIVPDTIKKYNGTAIIERVGHSFIKQTMKKINAIFGCENSAHYYFRDNFNADSGLIASLIVAEIVSKENKKLSELIKEFQKYSTLEETNFKVDNKKSKLKEIEEFYKGKNPKKMSKLDGLSVEFDEWWFNVRPSNTEPLLRLNLEANSRDLMEEKRKELASITEHS
ncbi:MAG: phosphomannomutase/phosphoglucomutase [Candidatus Woesearchaeota archaeon]|jgi:phosphomannomutase|nr:phosphomannomutase/phosphoglucomutase [Candidatus Woesearchaeota archaeon]MDP7622904.1 phosphomannomutase/phosphoglucomutase [Candidatus Woesearchaeota archaeon]HJN57367.1 phosphomannomutase/phosphoglucomutase [Candidatus Woesearchaeota archaeon]|tara:strand:- start:2703 stop:4046 length:1344 start_codon:yes stop_codon:yes gene_type:complete